MLRFWFMFGRRTRWALQRTLETARIRIALARLERRRRAARP
jgi:hypothetical protein